ncbi:MAG: hypothetical protein WBH84_08220 [Defluviitoga tunisiensis]|mgnify:FL=1|jgi:predicted thioesterase|uniref:Thioesterase-like protein n=1 Tax=Defluviitoga tunisiensis TaxID=1006576 RepID=A0A0C7P2G4_DEFTU|nr:hypothetical protein [Defluviitoga tunisiensis]CEP78144.1 thioesterase-like protein [Defluviitoga tunisiensis]
MNTSLEKISSLKGKEFNYSFKVRDDAYIWSEDSDVIDFYILSPVSLLEEIQKCCYDILRGYLDNSFVSVVSYSKIEHISFTPYSFKVFIKIKVTEVIENRVYFSGEVYDEIEKVAQFEVVRNIVSKKILKKNINEKINCTNLSEI